MWKTGQKTEQMSRSLPFSPRHIFIDADDTLWENEDCFRRAEEQYSELLAPYADVSGLQQKLWAVQEENIPIFGYGSKTYFIGMMETAYELLGGRPLPRELHDDIIGLITDLTLHPLEMIDGVEETLELLSRSHSLVLATKGDVTEQLMKLERSGLGRFFLGSEVMMHKSREDYHALARKYGIAGSELVMVGNSVRSDIIPVIENGGWAVHIPHEMVWKHELAPLPQSERLLQLESFRQLPSILP